MTSVCGGTLRVSDTLAPIHRIGSDDRVIAQYRGVGIDHYAFLDFQACLGVWSPFYVNPIAATPVRMLGSLSTALRPEGD